MKNSLEKLFQELNREKISYCVRGRYKHLPKTTDKGDIDILLEKKYFLKFIQIIRKLRFKFYPFTNPNKFYFLYDAKMGLIHLDVLLTEKIIPVKKYKSFYIPKNEKTIPNKKSFFEKIKTGIQRRIYYLFRGKLIVFEGPDGSGKTSNLIAVYDALKRLPFKKRIIHFATSFKKTKPSALRRLITRLNCLIKVCLEVFLGRVVLADRYVYLTFRKSHPSLRKILLKIVPKPDLVFVMKASPIEIRKRKEGQRDQLSIEVINELYNIYDSIPGRVNIDTKKQIDENLEFMVNKILEKTLI